MRCQQHVRGCFACVGSHDIAQQLSADDAACTPQRCDGVQLQVPTVFLACAGEQVHALCVRNELGCEECAAHILNELGVACTDTGGCDQTCGQFALCLLALLTLEEERARANTDSAIAETGEPRSRPALAVHRPVPFWPAASTITSTRGLPVLRLPVRAPLR